MKKSKFSEEQIVRILQEASSGKKTQAELCREHGVSQNTFYVWKIKYAGLETDDVRRRVPPIDRCFAWVNPRNPPAWVPCQLVGLRSPELRDAHL